MTRNERESKPRREPIGRRLLVLTLVSVWAMSCCAGCGGGSGGGKSSNSGPPPPAPAANTGLQPPVTTPAPVAPPPPQTIVVQVPVPVGGGNARLPESSPEFQRWLEEERRRAEQPESDQLTADPPAGARIVETPTVLNGSGPKS